MARDAILEAETASGGIGDALVREVADALARNDPIVAAALAEPLHPADQADLLERLPQSARLALIQALGEQFDPDTLSYLEEGVREQIFEGLGPQMTGEALAQLETDDAIDILSDLDDAEQEALLAALPALDRVAVEQGLAFPEYSAGRLMQRTVVAVPDYWTVGQTIDYLRAHPDLPDDFYDIYITDPRLKPVGSVPVSNVLRSRRAVPMRELRLRRLTIVQATDDQEEVAHMFGRYGLVSAPVVDESGRLLGVITVDDIVEVIEEEAEDDILKLGGVQESDVFASPWRTALARLPWLGVNLLTAIVASLVIAQFEGAIAQLVALAVLMPMVASMGGNAGTQTLTVAVRALAMDDLNDRNAWRVFLKEAVVGGLNGLIFLVVGAGTAWLWFGDGRLALVFGAAMLVNLCAAGVAGVSIPLILERFGFDPAVASTVFLTTVTDVVGFFAFLGLAVYFLL